MTLLPVPVTHRFSPQTCWDIVRPMALVPYQGIILQQFAPSQDSSQFCLGFKTIMFYNIKNFLLYLVWQAGFDRQLKINS